jgi:uncharacterized membrane protein
VKLTIAATTTTAVGTYSLTLTGVAGAMTHTAALSLTVAVPDFAVSASPSSATVKAGTSAPFSVAITSIAGFNSSLALSVSGLPTNASATWSATSVVAPGSATLTVNTATTTPGGTFTLTINATTSAKVVRSAKVTLTVLAPDFALASTTSSASVLQGQPATYGISITTVNGFAGNISLTASGYPSGATVSFSPTPVAAPGTSTLTIKPSSTSAVGTYTITITGTSATRVARTTKVTLVVNPAGDFGMTASADTITVKRGSSFSAYAYLTAQSGFYATVAFSATGLPAGVTATWGKTSLLVYGTTKFSVSVKFAASTSAVPGTYTVNLVGTCGGIVHTVPLTIVVV